LNQSEALTRGVPWHFGRIRPCNRVAWHPCQTRRVHRLIHEYGQKNFAYIQSQRMKFHNWKCGQTFPRKDVSETPRRLFRTR
jgi:hypothetical protein